MPECSFVRSSVVPTDQLDAAHVTVDRARLSRRHTSDVIEYVEPYCAGVFVGVEQRHLGAFSLALE